MLTGESWGLWSKVGDYEWKLVFMGGIWRKKLHMRKTWRFYAEVVAYGCDLALLEDVGRMMGGNLCLWVEVGACVWRLHENYREISEFLMECISHIM